MAPGTSRRPDKPGDPRLSTSVLIVEDEADIAELMQLHLKRAGYTVAWAMDGERGGDILARESFDLAILDWMLPGTSGLELCRRIGGRIPVLMVTARAGSADIVSAKDVRHHSVQGRP